MRCVFAAILYAKKKKKKKILVGVECPSLLTLWG